MSIGLVSVSGTFTFLCHSTQVHGGITEMDVIDFIQQAEEQARKNHKSKLDTVVFFDEANTTEAIGLIKEIVCDRRLHGKPLSPDLKFIAACNPYRKSVADDSGTVVNFFSNVECVWSE